MSAPDIGQILKDLAFWEIGAIILLIERRLIVIRGGKNEQENNSFVGGHRPSDGMGYV
jgi:hypothetical protein